MSLLAASPLPSAGPIAAGCVLAALAFVWLLPRPAGRAVSLGTLAAVAAAAAFVRWILERFGNPSRDVVENVLFWLFAAGSVGFAAVFLAQRNPARGAIAFAFVILSTCGLFLLLAAPFLMAATVIIYAGAIIVTFLFVLMLSHTRGPADENDRSREPLLGSLAGFAFLGLILLAIHQAAPVDGASDYALPARPLTADDRTALLRVSERLTEAAAATDKDGVVAATRGLRDELADVVGVPPTAADAAAGGTKKPAVPERLAVLADPRSEATRKLAEKVRANGLSAFNAVENKLQTKPNPTPKDIGEVKGKLAALREDVVLLSGQGELPARNVANVGMTLYTDHILAVEMGGAILLVATIGAVAVAGRKGVA